MEKYSKFKRYGNEIRFNYCPICGKEKDNPDFSVNLETGQYYCHSTGQGGSIKEIEGFDLKMLNTLKPVKVKNKETKNFNDLVFTLEPLNDVWKEYLKSRGISSTNAGIDKTMRINKYNVLTIPISDGKKPIAIKYRTMDKKISSEKGSQSDYFINWHNIKDKEYLIIVEGEIDLLSSIEVGFNNVVSLPFGAQNLKCIDNQLTWIAQFKKIIIAVDNDEQGEKSKQGIIQKLSNIKNKVYSVDLGEFKDFNEALTGGGTETLKNIILGAEKVKKDVSLFSLGDDGYYKINKDGIKEKITDFIIKDFRYSENYFKGLAIVDGREKKFITKKTELLTVKGILEYIGSYFGSPQSILRFWDWLKDENKENYIPEILHYGIIENKYYDEKSDVICSKQDLKIKDISQIEPLTDEEIKWLSDNLIYLRNDTCQSLLGVCWALGRFHINESYPILEVSGTTSIGKTEYVEFISRLLFGSKENIKNLSTMTNHQIRSFCSCSNITPLAIDEVKITNKFIKSNIENLYSTIRSVYDNKEVNQGNTTNKLTEFKLCTPLIISGETEIMETSIKNRMISTNLTRNNKSTDVIFFKLKESDLLEKLGKTALKNRLENGIINIAYEELKHTLYNVKDSRQLYNGKCILIGLKALNDIIKIPESVNNHFIEFLNKKLGEEEYTVTQNFIELLKMLVDIEDEELPTFYICDNSGHYARFTKLILALKEIVNKTDSTFEILDPRTLKKQLIEEGFIINPHIFKRFSINSFSKETKPSWAVEFKKINFD